MKSTTLKSLLYLFCINFAVSITILCWECLGVKKNKVLLFFNAYVNAGAKNDAVFPIPVGA